MWHKLREIFGYKDSRHKQVEASENQVDQKSENSRLQVATDQTLTSEGKNNSTAEESVSGASNVSVLESNNVDSTGMWKKYRDKWNEDCFECRVTTSVVTFLLMAHICRSFWNYRVHVTPPKRRSIVIANISLFGMWLAYMKQEWYDEKGNTTMLSNQDLSFDRFKS